MKSCDKKYINYCEILEAELKPAMGCTEPIAIAYCASKVKELLNGLPEDVKIIVSPNIIKNVKSVTVPNTNGKHGIITACAIGLIAGDPNAELQVIAKATKEQIDYLDTYLKSSNFKIEASDNDHTLYIEIIGKLNDHSARVIIQDAHTNITLIEKDSKIIYENNAAVKKYTSSIDKSLLNIKDIIDFADSVEISKVKNVLDRQISYNMAIAEEGIKNNYGANIGSTILKYSNNDLVNTCKAYAAAASDARMNGCDLPVVITSGSGNQGITASVPVIVYARKKNLPMDLLYRALVVSNLCTIHTKDSIGKLSAYCGVVIAGACCGAGIAYLEGGKFNEIAHTIVNALAIISGVVCDGAKSSCAAKIAASVESGIFAYYMYKDGNAFCEGDGIVKNGVEATIKAVGSLATKGMCETDKEIISIMID